MAASGLQHCHELARSTIPLSSAYRMLSHARLEISPRPECIAIENLYRSCRCQNAPSPHRLHPNSLTPWHATPSLKLWNWMLLQTGTHRQQIHMAKTWYHPYHVKSLVSLSKSSGLRFSKRAWYPVTPNRKPVTAEYSVTPKIKIENTQLLDLWSWTL